MSEGEVKRALIKKVIFGGDGLAHEDSGKVLFVPFTLPGEEIGYKTKESKRHFSRGQLQKVFKEHHERVVPRCPHYGVCGGCQLQHASYSLQLELKRKWLQESLKRIGLIDIDPDDLQFFKHWEYRRSVTWIYKEKRLGYSNKEGHFLPINVCYLLEDSQKALRDTLRVAEKLQLQETRVRFLKTDEGPILCIETDKISKELVTKVFDEEKNLFAGFCFYKSHQLIFEIGQATLRENILGLEVSYSALSFIQNHREGAQAFYSWIKDKLEKGPCQNKILVDLYCGVGITTLLAAALGFEAHGFEISSFATSQAKLNAQSNRLESCSHFYTADLSKAEFEKKLKSLINPKSIDTWIVNPPREGISETVLKQLLKSGKKLIYLSCDVTTLARDLRRLQERYEIENLKAFDCFGQTTHFETVVYLKQRNITALNH